jgi:Flp pilus assembly protein TadG
MRAARPRRRGNVTVLTAVSLVMLLSAVALSVDGGMLLDRRRQVQATADAAALAASGDLYSRYRTNYGLDPNGTARRAALEVAAANGCVHGKGCTVTVNVPPASGRFKDKAGYAEVVIVFDQPRYFSRVFGTDSVPVGGRSVARGLRSAIKNAIVTLDPAVRGSLNAAGNGSITITGANIQVNSGHAEAMIANGNGSLAAPEFDVWGQPGWATPGGGAFHGLIVPRSPPIQDPLRFLPPPDPATLPVRSASHLQISGNRTYELLPGVYVGGVNITGQSDVVLHPGVYYMKGGGFNWGGQGTLTGHGVMIYNAPESTSDKINISGSGNCSLSPPATGPYQGMCLFQDRTSAAPVGVTGSQGAQMTISGTFYAANADLSVSGNGAQQTIGSQYISRNLVLSGNGSYSVSWSPNATPGIRDLRLVE